MQDWEKWMKEVELGSQLTEKQWVQAVKSVKKCPDVFQEASGEAKGAMHSIRMPTG